MLLTFLLEILRKESILTIDNAVKSIMIGGDIRLMFQCGIIKGIYLVLNFRNLYEMDIL